MITKPRDYNEATSYGTSDFKPLPSGGYICRITQVEEVADKNGNPMIHFAFDIIDGEFTGYFMNLFQSRRKANTDPMKTVKYPFEGQMWIAVNDYNDPSKTNRKFKGFCTALEDSGTQVWNGDNFMMTNVVNAMIGIIFQNTESEPYEGKTTWRALPWACRSVQVIDSGDYFVPEDKPYEPKQQSGNSFGTFSATSDNVPF